MPLRLPQAYHRSAPSHAGSEGAWTTSQRSTPGDFSRSRREDRLDSWKKIASYLKRDVSTVQRWERREGLPVHRHLHDKQGSVFAFRAEVDTWWESRRSRLAREAIRPNPPSNRPLQPRRLQPLADTPGRAAHWLLGALVTRIAGSARPGSCCHLANSLRSPLEEARFTRLVDFPGFMQAAAISRDGRLVAFLGEPGRSHGRLG